MNNQDGRKGSPKAEKLISSLLWVASGGPGNGARYNEARRILVGYISSIEEQNKKLRAFKKVVNRCGFKVIEEKREGYPPIKVLRDEARQILYFPSSPIQQKTSSSSERSRE